MALPAPSLPIGTHRLGLRLLAAIVIAGTCLALATTAVLLALDDRLGKAPAILAATTAGTLVVALFIVALVGRWVTRHLEHMARHAHGPSLEVLVERRTAELQRANDDLVLTNARLEQAQMQLVQSEKMASIGVLAAGVAHEINNPIGFVSANLGTLGHYVGACWNWSPPMRPRSTASPPLRRSSSTRSAAASRRSTWTTCAATSATSGARPRTAWRA